MELAKLPIAFLVLLSAASYAEAAMWCDESVTFKPSVLNRVITREMSSDYEISSVSIEKQHSYRVRLPSKSKKSSLLGKFASRLTSKLPPKLKALTDSCKGKYQFKENKLTVKFPCQADFMACFSSYKPYKPTPPKPLQCFDHGHLAEESAGKRIHVAIPPVLKSLVDFTCEGETANLVCPSGQIRVRKAMYGRTDKTVCNTKHGKKQWAQTDCTTPKTLPILARKCDGLVECSLSVDNNMHGDPCYGTYKYLQVLYDCLPAPGTPISAVGGSISIDCKDITPIKATDTSGRLLPAQNQRYSFFQVSAHAYKEKTTIRVSDGDDACVLVKTNSDKVKNINMAALVYNGKTPYRVWFLAYMGIRRQMSAASRQAKKDKKALKLDVVQIYKVQMAGDAKGSPSRVILFNPISSKTYGKKMYKGSQLFDVIKYTRDVLPKHMVMVIAKTGSKTAVSKCITTEGEPSITYAGAPGAIGIPISAVGGALSIECKEITRTPATNKGTGLLTKGSKFDFYKVSENADKEGASVQVRDPTKDTYVLVPTTTGKVKNINLAALVYEGKTGNKLGRVYFKLSMDSKDSVLMYQTKIGGKTSTVILFNPNPIKDYGVKTFKGSQLYSVMAYSSKIVPKGKVFMINAVGSKTVVSKCITTEGEPSIQYQAMSDMALPAFDAPTLGSPIMMLRDLVCGGETANLVCPFGKITVRKAMFGRLDKNICNTKYAEKQWKKTDCQTPKTLEVLSKRCDGQTKCSVFVASSDLHDDPCYGTYKYLDLEYECSGEANDIVIDPVIDIEPTCKFVDSTHELFIAEAEHIMCVSQTTENASNSQACYNHKTGAPFYSIDKESNKIHLPIGCSGRFWVCYIPLPSEEETCPSPEQELDHGLICTDVQVENRSPLKGGKGHVQPISGASSIACMTLKHNIDENPESNCRPIGGKPAFSFKNAKIPEGYLARKSIHKKMRPTILVRPSCSAVFRVCYKPTCRAPFKEHDDVGCMIMSPKKQTFIESSKKCTSIGGRMAHIDDPFAFAQNKANKKGKFFIGGSKIFEKHQPVSFPKIDPKLTSVFTRPNYLPLKNLAFVIKATNNLKVPAKKALEAFSRFTRNALPYDAIRDAPMKETCLVLTVGPGGGPEFVNCNEKHMILCEQVTEATSPTKWSPWFNLDKAGGNEEESLSKIKAAIKKDSSIAPPLSLCHQPMKMECRDAEYKDTFYSPYVHHQISLATHNACDKSNKFKCYTSANKEIKNCPDIEVRFMCPTAYALDCNSIVMIEHCEGQKLECRNTAFGASCFEPEHPPMGNETIGRQLCRHENLMMHQCVSRGDPHMTTFDMVEIDQFRTNNGEFLFFDSKTLHKTEYGDQIPDFRIIVTNSPNAAYKKHEHIRAFELTMSGVVYDFHTDGSHVMLTVNGLKRSILNFRDDNIVIHMQMKGDRDGQPKLTIDTCGCWCMQIVWDSRQALYLRMPMEYATHKTGLCGNFDGNPDNDLTNPEDGKPMTQKQFTNYHMVATQDKKGCIDCEEVTKTCSPDEHKKYSTQEYCGVFNNKHSPFMKYVMANYNDKEENMHQLKMLFDDCMLNLCRGTTQDDRENRCYQMETHLEEASRDLMIMDGGKLDKEWREYAHCEKTKMTTCASKEHSHYESAYLVKCQPTCGNMHSEEDCGHLFGSGCVCDEGYFLDTRMNCVTDDECDDMSCFVELPSGESFTVKDGDKIVVEPCELMLQCTNGEMEEVYMSPCSIHAKCVGMGTMCECREGYFGDGRNCSTDEKKCREGFEASGDLCYKYNPTPVTWQKAAATCGSYGARLARYDTEQNEDLADFWEEKEKLAGMKTMIVELNFCRTLPKISWKGTKGPITLCWNPKFKSAHPSMVMVEVVGPANKACPNAKLNILKDLDTGIPRWAVQLTGCKKHTGAKFLVVMAEASEFKKKQPVTPWVGGNTYVLGQGKRNGMAPLNVDPPRYLDTTFESQLGCYQAKLNQDRHFVLEVNTECKKQQPFICEYENHILENYNPLDIMAIHKKVNWQEAHKMCAEHDRSLLQIPDQVTQDKVEQIMKADKASSVWIDAKFVKNGPKHEIEWADGSPMTFKKWNKKPKYARGKKMRSCMEVGKDKKWNSAECTDKKFPICGPPRNTQPTAFTPPFPVPTATSMAQVKDIMRKTGLVGTVCDKPAQVKCRAQRLDFGTHDSMWVTNLDQKSHTISCTETDISCRSGEGIDCTTMEVQFLCPSVVDQCAELEKIGATACDLGKECFPLDNHFFCRCPGDNGLGDETATDCEKEKTICSAWGDPHYTTYNGAKFDFMGDCMYLFSGVCESFLATMPADFPSFAVYTKNVECGKQGTCLERVEIHIKNLLIRPVGSKKTQKLDYAFKVHVNDESYKMNDRSMTQRSLTHGTDFYSLEVTMKPGYFHLRIPLMALDIILSGSRLDVALSSKNAYPTCGLCQNVQSKQNKYMTADGSNVDLKLKNNKVDFFQMAELAESWIVPDRETFGKCRSPDTAPTPCNEVQERELHNQCGILLESSGPLADCFEKVDPAQYYDDCMFDACVQDNSTEAACSMIAAYGQACLDQGIMTDWRSEEFCPMLCRPDEDYRVDASCEETCGNTNIHGMCDQKPEEGCVCREGLVREGGQCVHPEECGCDIKADDGSIHILPIGEKMLTDACTQQIKCVNVGKGQASPVHEHFSMPRNTMCMHGEELMCAKGYHWLVAGETGDNNTCVRNNEGCQDGFEDIGGMCIDKPYKTNAWRAAVQQCNMKDSVLVHVDTEAKLMGLRDMMVKENIVTLYLGGRLSYDRTQILKDGQGYSPELANFHVSDLLMSKMRVPKVITAVNPSGWAIVMSIGEDNEPIIAVDQTFARHHYVCEERYTEEKDLAWTEPCSSDTVMHDDGDLEYLSKMMLDPHCNVCPVPYEVRCNQFDPRTDKTSIGECSNNRDGLLYACHDKEKCMDTNVQTLCTKDVNECALGIDDCDMQSTCQNTIGAYKCKCQDKNYNMMVNGYCQEQRHCALTGPMVPNSIIYNFTSFGEAKGIWNYDCSYLLASPAKYTKDTRFPYADFALVNERDSGVLKQKLMGTIFSPRSKVAKAWMIDADLLRDRQFMFGENGELVKTSLNLITNTTGTKFIYKHPGVMMVVSTDNFFRARITMDPFSFQLDMASEMANEMHGVCSMKPTDASGYVHMSPEDVENVAFGPKLCESTKPLPTEAPVDPIKPSEPFPTPAMPTEQCMFREVDPITPVISLAVDATMAPTLFLVTPEAKEAHMVDISVTMTDKMTPKILYPINDDLTQLTAGTKAVAICAHSFGAESSDLTLQDILAQLDGLKFEKDLTVYEYKTSEGDAHVVVTFTPDTGKDYSDSIPSDLPAYFMDVVDYSGLEDIYDMPALILAHPGAIVGVTFCDEDYCPDDCDPDDDPYDDIIIDEPYYPTVCKNPEHANFCMDLQHMCNHPIDLCEDAICSHENTVTNMDVCEYLAKESFNNCTIDAYFTEQMDILGCHDLCDANMKFDLAPAFVQGTCFDPLVMIMEGEDSSNNMEFGCFCEPGFLLGGGKCVRYEECGCESPDDGTYMELDERRVSNDCSMTISCNGPHSWGALPFGCGANAQCEMGADGPQCACKKDFFGNPWYSGECSPGKVMENGSQICYEVAHPMFYGQKETRCNCSLGFISNCNDCMDVDECKLGLHDCDLSHEKCVNIAGGFECICKPGFEDDKGCVDIDECKRRSHNCSANEGCKNSYGSYECECCAGYMWDARSFQCIRHTAMHPALPDNTQCCHICNIPTLCEKSETEQPMPWCYKMEYSTYKSFASGQELFEHLCVFSKDFDQARAKPGNCEQIAEEDFPEIIEDNYPPVFDSPPVLAYSTPATPKNCEDPNIMEFVTAPSKNLASGPVCGPLTHDDIQTHESYEHMVRFVCRSVGGFGNFPKGAPISALAGLCPQPQSPDVQTVGPPMEPEKPKTTKSIIFRPRVTTIIRPDLILPSAPPAEKPTTTTTTKPTTTTTTRPTTTTTRPYVTQSTITIAKLRMIGGVKWEEALLDKDSEQFLTLKTNILKELTSFYKNYAGFRKISNMKFQEGSVIVYYAIEFDPSVAYDVPTIDSDLENMIKNNNNYLGIYLIDLASVKHEGEGPSKPVEVEDPVVEDPVIDSGPDGKPGQKPTTTTTTTRHPTTTTTKIPTTTTTKKPTTTTTERPYLTYPPPPRCSSGNDDRTFYEGEEWNEGPCMSCQCSYAGPMCMVYDCYTQFMDPPCNDLIYTDGECCPICADLPMTMAPPTMLPEYLFPTRKFTYKPQDYETYGPPRNPDDYETYGPPMNPDDYETYGPPRNPDDYETYGPPMNPDDYQTYGPPMNPDDYVTMPQPDDYTCYSEVTKKHYMDSESWSESACSDCFCSNGYTACTMMACAMPYCEHFITKPGECCPTCLEEPIPEYGPWTQWCDCHFDDDNQKQCGQGKEVREREMLPAKEGQAQYQPSQMEVFEEKTCFVPCPEDNGPIIDECPDDIICDHLAPVCGTAQPGPAATFQSECHLGLAACRAGRAPTLLYKGECNPDDDLPAEGMCQRDGPVKTSVKYGFNDTLEECFGPVTDIKTCASLLCAGGSSTCCKATDFEPVEVLVSCYGAMAPREFLRFRKHIHYSATACECQDEKSPLN